MAAWVEPYAGLYQDSARGLMQLRHRSRSPYWLKLRKSKNPGIKVLFQDQNAAGSRDGGLRVMTDLFDGFSEARRGVCDQRPDGNRLRSCGQAGEP